MNIEQAKKHRDVGIWFFQNPEEGVWRKIGKNWNITYEPDFMVFDKYVINDKFAGFRMAQADGKVIQSCFKMPDNFLVNSLQRCEPFNIEIDDICGSVLDPKHLRIKPDEPKCKIGDWVTDTRNNKNFCISEKDNIDVISKVDCYVRWEPKAGEWCCFWQTDVECYEVARYRKREDNGVYVNEYNHEFFNVAPRQFINTLGE